MGHGEHGNMEKVTSLLNIQKEIDNFSQFFLKKLIMIQINKFKNK